MEKREDMPKVNPDSVPEIGEIRKIDEVPDPNIKRPEKSDNPEIAKDIRINSGQVIYQ